MKRAVSVRKASEQAYSRVTEVSSVWEAISLDRVAMHHVKAVTDSHVRVVTDSVKAVMVSVEAMVSVVATTTRMPNTT